MINITLNDDYSLSCDTNVIPAQHSSNIPFKLVLPEKYKDSLVIPGYCYCDNDIKIESAVDNYVDGTFSLPSNAFKNKGLLGIAFSITTGDIVETTKIITFDIEGSVNTNILLNKDETWQSIVQNFMDKYMSDFNKRIDNLSEEIDNLQMNSSIVFESVEDDEIFEVTEEIIPCTSITLDATELVFENNESITLNATVKPSNTTDTIVWTSDDTSIATVVNGVVTPIKNGLCTITATCGEYSASCSVTINMGEIVMYSITNTLTNVTSDNANASVQEGNSYTANLTANSGYILDTVTVTMGGTDITNTVYSNGVINIENATGNIVITANAIQETTEGDIGLTDEELAELEKKPDAYLSEDGEYLYINPMGALSSGILIYQTASSYIGENNAVVGNTIIRQYTQLDLTGEAIFNGLIPYARNNDNVDGKWNIQSFRDSDKIPDLCYGFIDNFYIRSSIDVYNTYNDKGNFSQYLYDKFRRLPIKTSSNLRVFEVTDEVLDTLSGTPSSTPNDYGFYSGFLLTSLGGGMGAWNNNNVICSVGGAYSHSGNPSNDKEFYRCSASLNRFYYNIPQENISDLTLDGYKAYIKSLNLKFFYTASD